MRKRKLHKIKKPAEGYTAMGFDIKDCPIPKSTLWVYSRQEEESDSRQREEDPEQSTGFPDVGQLED